MNLTLCKKDIPAHLLKFFRPVGYKPGDVVNIPHMVAEALRVDGWILRQEIIWSKPAPMPESVTNRCTKSHEQIFLLSKSHDYYFDTEAIKERADSTYRSSDFMPRSKKDLADTTIRGTAATTANTSNRSDDLRSDSRNKRSVWSIEDDKELYNWLASAAPEVLAEFLMRHERCGEEHEHIFLLAKENGYYFDTEAVKEPSQEKVSGGRVVSMDNQHKQRALGKMRRSSTLGRNHSPADATRNRRSVWNVTHGGGYKGAHFATYPPKLIEPCILAGTSAVGCCPECGASWTRVIEKKRVVTRPGKDSKVISRSSSGLTGGLYSPPGQAAHSNTRLANAVTGNRDPERHVTESRTIGWRPGCPCYRLQLIGEQPSQPQQGVRETEGAFQKRYDQWESGMQEWLEDWKALKPLYEQALGVDEGAFAAAEHIGDCEGTVPCTVLDPFIGSGTTALVSLSLGRRCVGIDLSEEYLKNHCVQRVKATLLSRPGMRHLIKR